jgi:hypothetical protein
MKARQLFPAFAFLATALSAQENDPPARAGRVSSVAGTVAFQAAGTPEWSVTPLNYTVTSGDRLVTHQRSRAELEVGPFAVRLADSTDLSIVNLTDDFTQLGLTRGTMRVSVYRLGSRDSMEVDTPNGAMIIRSAGRYRIDVLEGVSTIVAVEDGVAELSGPALDYTLRRGETVELTGTRAINANMVPHPRNTDFDTWSTDRDRRENEATYSRYMSRDIPGGADLDRYGRWDYVGTYGYVWRPTVVTVGWVPYRHGRWVWSGVWGYTWVEDAPWGYAPFHYGRWVVVNGLWAWAPGPIIRRPYYAPALVVFVGGPRYHQAWFPLGWREPYYPRYRHSDRYLREVNIANVRGISNVDQFVDVRRADRIDYANRQATTVVSSDVFGRRPVTQNVASIKPEELSHAPIVRDRWEAPRLGSTQAQTQVPTQAPAGERPSIFRPRRDALPASNVNESTRAPDVARPEVNEPRRNAPLIFRNSPPTIDRRSPAPQNTRPTIGDTRSALGDPPSNDRARTVIRRNEPAPLPETSAPVDPTPRTIIRRGAEPEVTDRPSSRPSVTREPAPRASTPRESTSRPPEPRQSEPRQPEARTRVPSVSAGGAQRVPSRRPPGA